MTHLFICLRSLHKNILWCLASIFLCIPHVCVFKSCAEMIFKFESCFWIFMSCWRFLSEWLFAMLLQLWRHLCQTHILPQIGHCRICGFDRPNKGNTWKKKFSAPVPDTCHGHSYLFLSNTRHLFHESELPKEICEPLLLWVILYPLFSRASCSNILLSFFCLNFDNILHFLRKLSLQVFGEVA